MFSLGRKLVAFYFFPRCFLLFSGLEWPIKKFLSPRKTRYFVFFWSTEARLCIDITRWNENRGVELFFGGGQKWWEKFENLNICSGWHERRSDQSWERDFDMFMPILWIPHLRAYKCILEPVPSSVKFIQHSKVGTKTLDKFSSTPNRYRLKRGLNYLSHEAKLGSGKTWLYSVLFFDTG